MATATPVLPKLVGERVKRREDPRLIQGRGTYVDDIKIAGMLHLAFKRSDIAHGQHHARSTPAPPRRWTASKRSSPAPTSPKVLAPMPIGTPFPSPPHHAVAVDVVRYAGEPVAVVVASDRYLARDAADAIVVSIRSAARRSSIPKLAMTGKPGVIHADFPNNLAVALVPSGTGVAPDFSNDRQHRRRQGVCRGRSRDRAAHGEPSPGAERDGAARRASRTTSRARTR